jgi:hypothetical protein
VRLVFALGVVVLFGACGRPPDSGSPTSAPSTKEAVVPESSALTPEEQALELQSSGTDGRTARRKTVPAAQAGPVRIELISESGYKDARGRHVVDVMEQDLAYMIAMFETADGNPVSGVKPAITAAKGSRIVAMNRSANGDGSGSDGVFEFGIIGGKMGEDTVVVSYGEAKAELLLNVISLAAAGYPTVDDVPGALRWDDLMAAKLRFTAQAVEAEFPASIAGRNNKTVKIVGFMMPLEPEEKQKHFLLTSTPPSCFFHIPGGPSGAVEVFAEKGVEAGWEPMVLEGIFETVSSSELGVVYRLTHAKLIEP